MEREASDAAVDESSGREVGVGMWVGEWEAGERKSAKGIVRRWLSR